MARSYFTPSGPAPERSWSMTDCVSRAEPPPARITRGKTAGSTATPSASQLRSRRLRITPGGIRRNG